MVMLISYHIKAELCTLFDKVHKAFINSANAPSLCTFYRLPTVCLSADTAAQPVEARLALPGRGMFAMTWRGIAAARRRGDCRGLPAETKGAGTPRFLTPNFEAFSVSAILWILKLINAYKTHFVVNNSKSCYKM